MMELACSCPVVVCCRCTPTHKEKMVQLLKQYTSRPTCAVGVCTDTATDPARDVNNNYVMYMCVYIQGMVVMT